MAKQEKHKPDEKLLYDTIIMGTGVVGWATAMYAGRLDLKTLIIGETFGGTIILTHLVENYPGFKSLTGHELSEKLEEHAREYNIHILNDKVTKIKKRAREFHVETEGNKGFKAKTIVLCTGTEVRKLGIPGEKEFENKGVHYCALCDGPLYKGKIMGVVGGSDSAAKEALFLTEYAKKVYIIYRKEKIRAEPINAKRVDEKIKQGRIEIINNTNVKEIKGDGNKITSVILDKAYKGSKEFKLDVLFIEIGHVPRSELAKQLGVKLNQKEEIIINRKSETSMQGVFAAGDITDAEFKQAITGVGEGVAAAYQAYKYMKENFIK